MTVLKFIIEIKENQLLDEQNSNMMYVLMLLLAL